jgi:hypothetical protein
MRFEAVMEMAMELNGSVFKDPVLFNIVVWGREFW